MARQTSLDSERPIMANSIHVAHVVFSKRKMPLTRLFQNRNSKRFSTVSGSPSLAASERTIGSLPSEDPRIIDITHLGDGLERLENKPLQKQRFVPTAEKTDNLNKLALGAKVERALGRRMTGQDAVMRKPLDEKAAAATTA
ncbi:hypothetical protein N7540_012612 [Penicillium herquei]|nr:hypothetical protein N7540_012612 [Penicillium herquei]